jgi:hypothetical protein
MSVDPLPVTIPMRRLAMSIVLTEQQQQALDAQGETPPRVIDPRSNAAYYLVASPDYDAVRELLEEERRQKAIRAVGLRNAVGRMEAEL